MEHRNVFKKHPKKTMTIFLGICLIIILFCAECVLRVAGYLPEASSYKRVDTLVVEDSFFTDDFGIFKANPKYPWELPYRINSEGFRSDEFDTSKKTKSILLIGDSHAWGASASPITSSFADLLRNEGYDVYNTGIPGAGPTQYESLAMKYIPQLNPDCVIVSFSMQNDLKESPDPMIPHQNLWHVTNTGWIWGFNEKGDPMSANEAYQYYVCKPIWKLLITKTSLGTQVVNLSRAIRTALKSKSHLYSDSNPKANNNIYEYTSNCLRNIKKLSYVHKAHFHLVVIPALSKNSKKASSESFHNLFDEFNPIYLEDASEDMYNPFPDIHMNNLGHQYVKDNIITVIGHSTSW
ncbi:MAG: hypothetical protein HW406_36 [Candidatus Brocadiaceae bacterium]|nr:hypothetical protein [Candidatus Brocadiaceae bacterium]